ncbi:twin-arginine translocase TatA/TatE family subunit [Thermoflavimicrobium daqui]|uniref:Sec-independent protein translocase protein TatA n=1 Tax=Thermoflavimicrobium daqui TaxID=2137476 RepID=A0A364K902_9BACL|nr:twin-arginine translocase TatA/TatE family subunit [Thermoflavimicrobium daqui]RAL26773.1 twin-arginine translocase TatA/TatE family subunit [Thermoflavimicrobium daqui]
MFGSLGVFELVLILLVVLLLFGAKKLPELGKATGETIRSFRKAVSGSSTQEQKQELAKSEEGK